MEAEELKRKLMGLWEKTTHNSKELLALLFEYYFDMRYIEYTDIEGKVVSALCGIPYEFGFGRHTLKGLYIISLSTEEGYRKKGMLTELLSRMNERLREEFDFTFLVPHSELMADYYGSQGYFSSFFILEERFTPLHDFRKDYLLSLTDSDERIKRLKENLIDEIRVERVSYEDSETIVKLKKFIEEKERKGVGATNLCHTYKDLDYIMKPDSINNPTTYASYDSDGKVTGVAFIKKEELKRIRVHALYIEDTCSYYSLLDHIKRLYPDYSISINTSEPKYQTHSIIQETYASANPAGRDLDNTFATVEIPFYINKLLQPIGMVRLLRFENILEYVAKTRSDVEFKLHIRDYEEGESQRVYVVKGGRIEVVPLSEYRHDRSVLNLNVKEVSELLLRKNDTSNLIMEAFGIPRLNLQIRLLPC